MCVITETNENVCFICTNTQVKELMALQGLLYATQLLGLVINSMEPDYDHMLIVPVSGAIFSILSSDLPNKDSRVLPYKLEIYLITSDQR